MKQGCPLSPILFNVYIADLEREMRKVNEEGVRIGRGKVWTITYADDSTRGNRPNRTKRNDTEIQKVYRKGKIEVQH